MSNRMVLPYCYDSRRSLFVRLSGWVSDHTALILPLSLIVVISTAVPLEPRQNVVDLGNEV